jgi:predicted nuclease with TOPRIM domain
VVKEKNALAERLKSAEAARKRFDEELKRFATETVTREEVRQSLENEVKRLRQTVGQTEGGLREKEEQIIRCEAYIDGFEAKLNACQVCNFHARWLCLLHFLVKSYFDNVCLFLEM